MKRCLRERRGGFILKILILNDFGLEHSDITRARGAGACWWDEAEELAERFRSRREEFGDEADFKRKTK